MLRVTSDVWWKNAIIYCLDIETFKDSNEDGIGDLTGAIEKIDYLAGIGVTCIWLMPFYVSPGLDDGYDISDFYSVRDEVGSLGDFTDFVRTARDRGIRVIADLVVNHTSDQHPWFLSARADRNSPFRDFYIWREKPPENDSQEVMFPGEQESRWGHAEETDSYYLHSFYSHQPDLNFGNPRVRDEVAKLIGFWIQQGLSGFRVDAVPFLVDTEDLPPDLDVDNHAYIADLRQYVGRRSGTAILLGEVNVEPQEQKEFFHGEHGDQLHTVFSFPLNQAMYLALAREDPGPVIDVLRALPDIPEEATWANFVRNHDELTLDKLSDEERTEVFEAFGPSEEMQIFGRGLRRRLPPMLGGDQRRIRMVYSLMFSLPGSPVLFYGEEIGMGENLDIEGRMSVRTPMQWSEGSGGGFSTADPRSFFRPMVDDTDYGPDQVNVAQQRRDPDSLLNWMEKLIRERRECPEIGWGEWSIVDSVDAPAFGLQYDWRGRELITIHNLSGDSCKVRLQRDEAEGRLHDLLGDRTYEVSSAGVCEIGLDPYDLRWIRVDKAHDRHPPRG